ncbi:MAG: hypothetical protein RMJ13_07670 [Elusimicrobiota bacterium]|nr:hypothetical protein [Elusimicrobiota bacterium]
MKLPEEKEELKKQIINSIIDNPNLIEEFLAITDIRITQEIPSLAVTLEDEKMYLLINKEFVEKYCETEKDLKFVLYHEFYHIFLGHLEIAKKQDTQLKNEYDFEQAMNIAFDALVNSLLVKKFKNPSEYSILKKLYSVNNIIESLLRPPQGYEENDIKLKEEFPLKYKWLIKKLYSSPEGVSFGEILQMIEELFKLDYKVLSGDLFLLGTHPISSKDLGSNKNIISYIEKLLGDIYGGSKGNSGKEKSSDKGYSNSSENLDSFKIKFKSPNRDVVNFTRKLILKLLQEEKKYIPTYVLKKTELDTKNIIPNLNIPNYIIKQESNLDVIFYDVNYVKITLDRPEAICNVYVDVSGSMEEYYEVLYSSLKPFVSQGLVKVYLWSTKVKEIKISEFLKGISYSTFGTEIECVLKHILETKKVKKALIFTDGIFLRPNSSLISKIKERKIVLEAAITSDTKSKPFLADLKEFCRKVHILPKI